MASHSYHASFTYKIFCASKSAPDKPFATFAQCLEMIKGLCKATAGCPQIVYLTGWQHAGHDSKYPDWSVVNPRLAEGADPVAEMRTLMRVARQYNATVSVHINMDDAYPNSPLFEAYRDNDLLLKGADGAVLDGDIWDGERCHWICKSREWATGFARRRIDTICKLLPLREAGTVHIDAFRPNPSPGHHTDWAIEAEACRSIVGYWNSLGIDVTTEYLADPELAPLHPMVYHDNRDEHQRLHIPPSTLCGGGAGWRARGKTVKDGAPGWWGASCAPAAGCWYPQVWGESIDKDLAFTPDNRGQLTWENAAEVFYVKSLPCLLLNRSNPVRFEESRNVYTVDFANGTCSSLLIGNTGRDIHRITCDNRVVLEGSDWCIPLGWRPGSCIARHGVTTRRVWEVGGVFGTAERVTATPLGASSSNTASLLFTVQNGRLEMDLPLGIPFLVEWPAQGRPEQSENIAESFLQSKIETKGTFT